MLLKFRRHVLLFVREIEPLLNMNLIKGGDLKNAVVIYDEIMPQETMDKLTDKLHQSRIDATVPGYLSGNLIFRKRTCPPQIADVIGDLSLIGKPIKGKVIAAIRVTK